MNTNNPELFADVRELCVYCAKGIAMLSKKHNTSPQLICKLFIKVFQVILGEMEK
jgi:hypothetical protein